MVAAHVVYLVKTCSVFPAVAFGRRESAWKKKKKKSIIAFSAEHWQEAVRYCHSALQL